MDDPEIAGLRATVDELENHVEKLTQRLRSLEKTVEAIRSLGEDFWRTEAMVLLLGATSTSWCYVARDENTLFPDMFACETNKDGTFKRWLGKSGELGATVAINRAVPLVFNIHVVGFSMPELAKTLSLDIDGSPVPWSASDGRLWSGAIPEKPGHARLQFRVAIDRTLLSETKDVSFAIGEIRISPATVVDARSPSRPTLRAAKDPAPAREA